MADYDLAEAFKAIEDELIASMIRNLARHRKEEAEQEMNWTQWQIEQLNALELYRKNNQKKFGKQFENINSRITQLIRDYYSDGETEQERKILQAIKRGYKINGTNKPAFTGKTHTTGEFFGVNDRKLEALITATNHDMERAETAVLRLANDNYRKAIFNAQVYANAGGTTYKKAVDMAVKDMLNAGLNCVEYKNGARHTLSNYADMAIRTATTRAYLQGEGAKRKEWGISTVILNKRSCPCPKCLPFVGKVFVDDVWSGGTAKEAEEKGYPLLSTAIEHGLYHPNCKDIHTTYFEGISTPPQKPTAEEKQQAVDEYNQEQKAHHNALQAQKCERISKYSLDEENKRIYKARAEQWREKSDFLLPKKDLQNIEEKMAFHFPKGFVDRRNVGDKISEEVLQEFINTAKELNVILPVTKNSKCGGFDTYCGKADVLFEMLEHLKKNQKILTELTGDGKIILEYRYLVDGGAIDVGTFACTQGRTITLNKFMYDDTTYLKKEYAEAVLLGKFTKGTTYKNIIDHECGHLFARNNKLYLSRLRKVCEERAISLGITSSEYIIKNISEYADFSNELPAEVNAMRFGSESKFALELLREAGLI